MTPWVAFAVGLLVATVVNSSIWYIAWSITKTRADEAEKRLAAILFEWRQLQAVRGAIAARVEDPFVDTHLMRELTRWVYLESRLLMIMRTLAEAKDAKIHIERK